MECRQEMKSPYSVELRQGLLLVTGVFENGDEIEELIERLRVARESIFGPPNHPKGE